MNYFISSLSSVEIAQLDERSFLYYLKRNYREEYQNYPLTKIMINSKIAYWMNPTVQKWWEEFSGIKREFKGDY